MASERGDDLGSFICGRLTSAIPIKVLLEYLVSGDLNESEGHIMLPEV